MMRIPRFLCLSTEEGEGVYIVLGIEIGVVLVTLTGVFSKMMDIRLDGG